MPPYETQSPIGAAIAEVSGWAAGQQQAKQTAIENDRQNQALAIERARLQWEQQQDLIRRGIDPKTGKPYASGVPPLKTNATPQERVQWDIATSIALMQQGDLAGANYFKSLADTDALAVERASQADYAQSGVGLRRSQTQLNDAKTKNVQQQFAHDIAMLSLRGANAAAVARIRSAYRGAGGGRGNSAAIESRALDAALNAASREQVGDYNRLQESIYRYQTELHAEDPSTYPNEPQAPQFIPIPVQTGGGQTTIMVMPNGQAVPARNAAPIVRRSTPNVSRPAPATTAPQQSSSGFGPVEDLFNNIKHAIFGGSSSQRIVQRNKTTGAYRHSDDGGKTWQPGP